MTSVVTPMIIPCVTPAMTSGLPGLADAGDQAVFDADVGFVNAGVIDDQGVGDDAIQRIRLAHARRLALAFANGFAAAEFAFVAVDREVALDFQNKRRVAQADAVARGRAEHLGVMPAFHFVRHRVMTVDGKTSLFDALAWRPSCPASETGPSARLLPPRMTRVAGDLHQPNGFGFARLEAHGRPGRNIEAFAVGLRAVKFQRGIGLDEMIMAADLNRTVAQIGDRQA